MKAYFLLFLFLIPLNNLLAQDGQLDASFGIDGIVRTDILDGSNDVANAVLIQPDDKIIAAGFTTDTLNHICLVRYHKDGSLDQSFGTNGIAITYFPEASQSNAAEMALQKDGRIIVVGSSRDGIALVRFKVDGSLDETFGEMGIVTTAIQTNGVFANALALQLDGKIVVGGTVFTTPPDGSSFTLLRYHRDGSLDSSFGTDGITITDIVPGSGLVSLELLTDLVLQEDQKIVVSGSVGPNAVLLRYHSNGSLDTGFGDNGQVVQNFSNLSGNSLFNALGILENGSIVATGFTVNGYSEFLLTQYDSNGQLDPSFGNDGVVISSLSPLQDGAKALLIQPDQKIIVGGGRVVDNLNQFTLARYGPEGLLDPSFGVDGVTTTRVADNSSFISSMAFQEDGNIVVAGSNNSIADSDFILARYTSALVSNTDLSFLEGDISVYPNPVTEYCTIEYQLNQASAISIKLFTVDGRFVKSFIDGLFKVEGLHSDVVDMRKIGSGIYFVSVFSGENNQVFKLVKW